MLVIRMQRTGRKGHAQFRVVVQDSRRTPTSGKIVASIGHFNPHTKETSLDKEKASFYLEHGAQPSERVVRLLKQEGVKIPAWVTPAVDKSRAIRHGDKLRKNRPAEVKEKPVVEPEIEVPAGPDSPVVDAAPIEAEEPTAKEAVSEPTVGEIAETESPEATSEPAAQPETPAEESEDTAEITEKEDAKPPEETVAVPTEAPETSDKPAK